MKAKKKDLESELIDDLLSDDNSDETIRLASSEVMPPPQPTSSKSAQSLNFDKSVKASVGRFAVKSQSPMHASSGASLIQSENLRVAQQKITELETELERIRSENEALAAAGQALKGRNEELMTENEQKQKKLLEIKDSFENEREILSNTLTAKDRETKELKLKIEEYEKRLSTNLQKIRVRERELENRLELIRMESSALVRSKDELLLDLKRQIDQINIELENYRNKSQGLNKKIEEKRETLRRTVKALRLALSMLESDDAENS